MTDTDHLDIIFISAEHFTYCFCLKTDGAGRCFHNKQVTILAMLKSIKNKVNSLFKRQLPLSLRFSVDSPRRRFFLDKRGIPFLAPLPEEIGNDFLGYLKGKGVAVEGAQAERERPFWTVELKREIVSRYSGQEEGIAAVSDKDPQLVKAVEILEGERGG